MLHRFCYVYTSPDSCLYIKKKNITIFLLFLMSSVTSVISCVQHPFSVVVLADVHSCLWSWIQIRFLQLLNTKLRSVTSAWPQGFPTFLCFSFPVSPPPPPISHCVCVLGALIMNHPHLAYLHTWLQSPHHLQHDVSGGPPPSGVSQLSGCHSWFCCGFTLNVCFLRLDLGNHSQFLLSSSHITANNP